MLEVNNLCKAYGKSQVLNDISFRISKGEIVGFIGPNGSGKSTTMKCISRLVFPDKGDILIEGKSLRNNPKECLSQISCMIESPGFYSNLTGYENLRIFAGLKNVHKEKVEEVIQLINLGNAISKMSGKYSMGMKQRLGLGIALLSDPEYLILDEPFTGLDPHGVFEFRNTLIKLAQKGVGILLSSHQLLELEKVATRNIFIKNGELVNRATIEGESLSNVYKISFLGKSTLDKRRIDYLKDKSLVAKVELLDNACLVWLEGESKLSEVLAVLLKEHYQILSVSPVDKDLENLYLKLF